MSNKESRLASICNIEVDSDSWDSIDDEAYDEWNKKDPKTRGSFKRPGFYSTSMSDDYLIELIYSNNYLFNIFNNKNIQKSKISNLIQNIISDLDIKYIFINRNNLSINFIKNTINDVILKDNIQNIIININN